MGWNFACAPAPSIGCDLKREGVHPQAESFFLLNECKWTLHSPAEDVIDQMLTHECVQRTMLLGLETGAILQQQPGTPGVKAVWDADSRVTMHDISEVREKLTKS